MADFLDKQVVGDGSGVPLGGIIRLAPDMPDDVQINGQNFIRSGLAVANADPSLPDSAIGNWESPPAANSDFETDEPFDVAINQTTGIGFIVGWNNIAAGEPIVVYKTVNFGASWERQAFTNPLGASATFRARSIVNRGDCWAMMDDGNGRQLIYTVDGGNTWQGRVLSLTGTAEFVSTGNLGFVDDSTLAIGYWQQNANMAINTYNLLQTNTSTTNRAAIVSGNKGKFGGILESNGTIIAALTTVASASSLHTYRVTRSTNGGESWTDQDLSTLKTADSNGRVYGIAADGAGRWIIGTQTGAIISTDDGLTWSDVTGVSGTIYGVTTDGSGNWVLVRNGNQLYRSVNNGDTFTLETAPTDGQTMIVGQSQSANQIQFVDKSIVLVGRWVGVRRNRVGFGIELSDPDASSYYVRYL